MPRKRLNRKEAHLLRPFLALLLLLPACAAAQQTRILGGPGGGCIAGAAQLPAQGPGFQTIRSSKSHFWGAPTTIAALERLAVQAHAAGLPDLYMNDIGKHYGGPFPGVHATHMLGLDADVWLDVRPKQPLSAAERDAVDVQSLVMPGGREINPSVWSKDHVTLLRLAAALPGVDRVLVNPAIKRQLCRDVAGDRSWLNMIRPWWGHAAHMHIHFRCPPGQTACADQAPRPTGEGCDASLQWWFDQLDLPPKPPGKPAPPPVLPAACKAIMAGEPG